MTNEKEKTIEMLEVAFSFLQWEHGEEELQKLRDAIDYIKNNRTILDEVEQ